MSGLLTSSTLKAMDKFFSFLWILVVLWVLLTRDPAIYLGQFISPIYMSRQMWGGPCGRTLWADPVGGPCWRTLWADPVGGPCGRTLWADPVGRPCGRILWADPVGGPVGGPHGRTPWVDPMGRPCRWTPWADPVGTPWADPVGGPRGQTLLESRGWTLWADSVGPPMGSNLKISSKTHVIHLKKNLRTCRLQIQYEEVWILKKNNFYQFLDCLQPVVSEEKIFPMFQNFWFFLKNGLIRTYRIMEDTLSWNTQWYMVLWKYFFKY